MRRLSLPLLLVLASAVHARGQSEGGVRGAVRDSQGILSGASVVLRETSTNIERQTVTNDQGEYLFPSVPPGRYVVEASLDGYPPRQQPVDVGVQSFFVVDITLMPGFQESITVATESPVLETATASRGDTLDSVELETLPTYARNPWYVSLTAPNAVQTGTPDFQRSVDQNSQSAVSITGGPTRANNYTIDGLPVTDLRNRAVIIPSIESIEEIKVQSSTYDAGMGRTGGGVFNAVHKRGSNQWRGSTLYQNRPQWGQALDFFEARSEEPPPDSSYWLYGGSVGGPILRDKTFFWVSTEGFREKKVDGREIVFPTTAEAIGDFSQSPFTIYDPLTTRPDPDNRGGFLRDPFPGNVIPPARISPVGLQVAQLLPIRGGGLLNVSTEVPTRGDQFSVNVTHAFDDSHSLSGTYMFFDSSEGFDRIYEGAADGNAGFLERQVHVVGLNYSSIPNTSSFVQLRYGYNQFDSNWSPESFDVSGLAFSDNFKSQVSPDTFPGIGFNFLIPGLGPGVPNRQRWYSHTANATVTQFVGSHSVSLGGSFRRLGLRASRLGQTAAFDFSGRFTSGPDPFDPARRTGYPVADLLLGVPVEGSIEVREPGDYFVNYFGGFVQDDWRVSENVVLNLGLRAEHETGLREKDNRITVGFARDTPWPVQPIGGMTLRGGLMYAGVDGNPTHQGDPTAIKLGPRAGFSWSLDERTVVRGGYGLYWAPIQYGGAGSFGLRGFSAETQYVASTDGFLTPAGTLTDPFPNGLEQPLGSTLELLTGAGTALEFVDQSSESSYFQQFSAGVERELSDRIAISASYLGSRGARVDVGGEGGGTININQLAAELQSLGPALAELIDNPFFGNPLFGPLSETPTIPRGQLLRPYPQFRDLLASRVTDGGRSRYHSVILGVKRRFQGNWGARVNYTWSKFEDNVFGNGGFFNDIFRTPLDSYDLEREYVRSSADIPHRLNVSGIFALPFGEGKRWLRDGGLGTALAGGWTVSVVGLVQSGFPLRLVAFPNTGIFTQIQRPNVVPGVDPILSADPEESLQYLNPDAWEQPAAFTLGNFPRTDNDVRNRYRNLWDVAFIKSNRIGGTDLTLRFEWMNVFSRPEFSSPFQGFGLPQFGQFTRADGTIPRTFQFTVRLGW